MGSPVPITFETIDPDLWYCVSVEGFVGDDENTGCVGFQNDFNSCNLGSVIIEWIATDQQCIPSDPFGPPPWNNKRITSITGGFLTLADCNDAGCP